VEPKICFLSFSLRDNLLEPTALKVDILAPPFLKVEKVDFID